ncbi:MAG: OmpA family protein [Alphaproteobacteria bacterium]|nr:OmpA family protein [Alphaproteobacteria bacterium]
MRIGLSIAFLACQIAVAQAADASATIPLQSGLVVVSAISESGVDFEGVRTVSRVDAQNITIDFRWTGQSKAAQRAVEDLAVTRIVRREDLLTAKRVNASFGSEDPTLFPGATAIQTSAQVLQSLKSGQDTPFVFGVVFGGHDGIFSALLTPRKYYRGVLKPVGRDSVPFNILLNGKRTTVRAIHARGTLTVGSDGGEAEFWWLDQADNALTLRWKFKGDVVQVVRIDTPPSADRQSVAAVAPGLASPACRAELHGVYFDTGSADLLHASDRMIADIAEALKAEPTWQVTIEGHTDNVGSDSANLTLSKNRAEAVRAALLARGGIGAERLKAMGFGETRPVESNETLEGRARNRRVELSRKCS